jgi:glycosyltransferase involved in cell wall biosynthesis
MWLYAKAERFTIKHADSVIGTGPGLVQQVKSVAPGKSTHHIFDIPSSFAEATPEETDRLRKRLRRNESDLLITFVGSFAVYQGVDLMFEAMPAVVRRKPEARFVVIGGTPAEIAARREWLAEKKAEESVALIGKVPPEELPDYLSASDVLLSPRLVGVNTPLKLLDYLKAGRAIVATDTESNRLILDEETALIVEPKASALADGICRLLDHEDLRVSLGRNGRKLITEKYNFTEFKKRLGACYGGMLGG